MDGKDRIIAELQERNAKLTARIERLTARIAELELAGNILFAAGPAEAGEPRLLGYAIEDGRLLSESPLPAAPNFNGVAIAHSRLYLALKDGSPLCLEGRTARTDNRR